MSGLTVILSMRVDVDELSALALDLSKGDCDMVVVGGGQDLEVCRTPYTPFGGGWADDTSRTGVRRLVSQMVLTEVEQDVWESVAVDGRGDVFLATEFPVVCVFDSQLSVLHHVIELEAPDDLPPVTGFALMGGGHVLAVTVREPVCLIEFGPAGDDPRGITGPAYLHPSEEFSHAAGSPSSLARLRVYRGAEDADINRAADLAVDPSGGLWIFSREALHQVAEQEGEFVVLRHMRLPDELVACGLVTAVAFTPAGDLLVGVDTGGHRQEPNVWQLALGQLSAPSGGS